MSQSAIAITDVWKSYERGRIYRKDLRSAISHVWSDLGKKGERFYALREINLNIQQGDIFGIVGPNGAGKSTLLKLLSRITFPSKGKMVISGTLSSMLEVGTGFHPELTGRENIFLNGAIIGMTRLEVAKKLDSIIDFSGIENFIDTPVKHYSSGMYVRLAFSVASHLEPDILLIDEVLAVGDEAFRNKCLDRLSNASVQGRTIIMVSHQIAYLRALCNYGAYLNEGTIRMTGTIDEVISTYAEEASIGAVPKPGARKDRKGDGRIRVVDITMMHLNEGLPAVVCTGQETTFAVTLEARNEARNVDIRLEFFDIYGQLWFITRTGISGELISHVSGTIQAACVIPKFPLNKNFYQINIAVFSDGRLSDEVMNAARIEVESGKFYQTGKLPLPSKGMLVDYHWKVL